MITLRSTHEEFLAEMHRVYELYALKKTMRYETVRDHSVHSESVGEHLYAMFVLADYFIHLEELADKLDRQRVHELILYHEIGEIDTGDIVSYKKTPQHLEVEREAARQVSMRLPKLLSEKALERFREFDAVETEEAQFAEALDKIEPIFEMLPEAHWPHFKRHGMTKAVAVGKKTRATERYPFMRKFLEVWTDHLDANDVFAAE